jgi:hypothetical protein
VIMESESSLYQKVWGEPDISDGVHKTPGDSGYEPDPVEETFEYSSHPSQSSTSWADGEPSDGAGRILRRLEQIEERISQIRQSEADSRQLLENGFAEVADALKDLESRMNRLEKGVVRSLEYLESRIEALGR